MTATKTRKSAPISIRLSPEAYEAVEEWSRRSGRPLGTMAAELVHEAVQMRRFPGIVFAGPPGDRRARVISGPDVWEIIAVWRACGNEARTLELLEQLSPSDLAAALRYAQAYPEEVDRLIAENERSRETWERLYPHLALGRP